MSAVTKEELQRLITRGPYHQWLGLQVLDCGEEFVEVKYLCFGGIGQAGT